MRTPSNEFFLIHVPNCTLVLTRNTGRWTSSTVRGSERPVQGVSWYPWNLELRSEIAYDAYFCVVSKQVHLSGPFPLILHYQSARFRGVGWKCILLNDKTWFLTLTSLMKNGSRAHEHCFLENTGERNHAEFWKKSAAGGVLLRHQWNFHTHTKNEWPFKQCSR